MSRARAAGIGDGVSLLRALWSFAIPVALAALAIRYLVPLAGEPQLGKRAEAFARAVDAHPIECTALAFLLFAGFARYWQPRLPLLRAWPAADAHAPRTKSRMFETLSFAVLLVCAAGAAFALRFVYQPYRVLSASMLPTLEPGDRILVSKAAYGLRLPGRAQPLAVKPIARGDLIVLDAKRVGQGDQELVKRVVGLPGDTIRMRGGHPEINGWPVPACEAGTYAYVTHERFVQAKLIVETLEGRSYLTVHTPFQQQFADSYLVKPGEAFVLGDNRNSSSDSRAWNHGHGGGLPFDAVNGRVERMITGTARDGRAELDVLFQPLGVRLHVPDLDDGPLRAGIARCLRAVPAATHVPDA